MPSPALPIWTDAVYRLSESAARPLARPLAVTQPRPAQPEANTFRPAALCPACPSVRSSRLKIEARAVVKAARSASVLQHPERAVVQAGACSGPQQQLAARRRRQVVKPRRHSASPAWRADAVALRMTRLQCVRVVAGTLADFEVFWQ